MWNVLEYWSSQIRNIYFRESGAQNKKKMKNKYKRLYPIDHLHPYILTISSHNHNRLSDTCSAILATRAPSNTKEHEQTQWILLFVVCVCVLLFYCRKLRLSESVPLFITLMYSFYWSVIVEILHTIANRNFVTKPITTNTASEGHPILSLYNFASDKRTKTRSQLFTRTWNV